MRIPVKRNCGAYLDRRQHSLLERISCVGTLIQVLGACKRLKWHGPVSAHADHIEKFGRPALWCFIFLSRVAKRLGRPWRAIHLVEAL